eukprot:CAMPEP_0118932856 /NCGR_PEP_ID=MMETSP1169-20130426/10656_1 /TAXON_ID=36882 /ORGANISM="Pyramimonas obovata, Strain CCMP722" /LENGTH=296 /DNA_ID=CAMNT_0006875559 /DNA_START=132 /DNA_END=1018 /DNA_ORIENTATION=-
MSSRQGRSAYHAVFIMLVGMLRASAIMLDEPMSEEDVMRLWSIDSSIVVTAADLQSANHPANQWILKLKTSYAGVMEAVCGWEQKPQKLQKGKATLLSSVLGAPSAPNLQATELRAFVDTYEQFRSSSGDQICSRSKQFLRGLDFITVGTTNVTALKEFQHRMGNFVAYTERNMPVRMLQNNAGLWGLDRIDQQDLPFDNTFAPAGDGAGVHVYILDTGINSAHTEFAGRIGDGYDFVDNDSDPEDCQGHGTHCAGTALGATYGVARAATLHGVRVLDCGGGGTWASVIGGMNWVA